MVGPRAVAQNTLSAQCTSPAELFRGVPDLTSTTDVVGTQAFAYGGNSDIWRGVERGEGTTRDVVVKIIRVTTRDKVCIDRIEKHISREVVASRSLDHKNILPLYGLCWLPGHGQHGLPSFVYPYCEAGTCIDYLKAHPDTDRTFIVQQVANALDYLHTLNPPVVHGDIKACNILVKKDGTPLLADFGLSRVILEVPTGFTTSSARGTCRWMAPELFGNVETDVLAPVSKESDVWAFGCLCLEIIWGVLPWAPIQTNPAIIYAVTSKRQPTLPTGAESTPIGHIVQHCWVHKPEDRSSMTQLAPALLHSDPERLHNPTCKLQPASVTPTAPDGATSEGVPPELDPVVANLSEKSASTMSTELLHEDAMPHSSFWVILILAAICVSTSLLLLAWEWLAFRMKELAGFMQGSKFYSSMSKLPWTCCRCTICLGGDICPQARHYEQLERHLIQIATLESLNDL